MFISYLLEGSNRSAGHQNSGAEIFLTNVLENIFP